MGEIPGECRKVNVVKKVQKNNPRKYRQVSFTLVPFPLWKNRGASNLGAYFWAHEREKGIWEQKMDLCRINHA